MHFCVCKDSVPLLIRDAIQETATLCTNAAKLSGSTTAVVTEFWLPRDRPLSKLGRARLHTHVYRDGHAYVEVQADCGGFVIINNGKTKVL